MVESMGKNSKYGNTAIHHAAGRGHAQIVKTLIGCIENPNLPNNSGWTPLHIAKVDGHYKSMSTLLGPNEYFREFKKFSMTIGMGYIDAVKSVIECTENPNTPDDYGTTPIYLAAKMGHIEIVKILIGCTDNPNAPSRSGQTPIHCAARNGHTEIVKALIECNTEKPNAPDISGLTPIYLAAMNGHTEIVKALIKCSDYPYVPNNHIITARHGNCGTAPIYAAARYVFT